MLTKDAVLFFKGKSKLAAVLKVSPAAVSQWGDVVPQLRQFQLQCLSGGQLKVDRTLIGAVSHESQTQQRPDCHVPRTLRA